LFDSRPKGQPNRQAAAGWAALRELAGILIREKSFIRGAYAFFRQNKPGGFACVSCAWTKPAEPQLLEICESGGKATARELTRKKVSVEFFENTACGSWSPGTTTISKSSGVSRCR